MQPNCYSNSLSDDSDGLETKLYRQGNGVDAIAGLEAVIVISVKHLLIPCAHAPGLAPNQLIVI